MSRGQNYSPPGGTKHKWHPKGLQYSPWVCPVWSHWPADIVCRVDLTDAGMFTWHVIVIDFHHKRYHFKGQNNDPLQACLEAEKVAEAQKSLLWLPWMEVAVAAGWRPPC